MKLSDAWIRNAIASGALTPPPQDLARRRPWSWGEMIAWGIVLAGLVVLGFAYGRLFP